jgi:hypothetical protein
LNAKYKEDKFVNIVESHKTNQTNINSTIKIAAIVVEDIKSNKCKKKMKTYSVQKQD